MTTEFVPTNPHAAAIAAHESKTPAEREQAIREQLAAGKAKYQPAVGGPPTMNVPGTQLNRGEQAVQPGAYKPDLREMAKLTPAERFERIKAEMTGQARYAKATAQPARINAELQARRDALAPLEAARAEKERQQGHALSPNQVAAYEAQKQRILAGEAPLDYSAQQQAQPEADPEGTPVESIAGFTAPPGFVYLEELAPVYEAAACAGVDNATMQKLAVEFDRCESMSDERLAAHMQRYAASLGISSAQFEPMVHAFMKLAGPEQ